MELIVQGVVLQHHITQVHHYLGQWPYNMAGMTAVTLPLVGYRWGRSRADAQIIQS